MPEIGPVRISLVLQELPHHRDTEEASPCLVRPYSIFPRKEQEWRRAEVRHARHGCVLTVHVLLSCAAGRTLTEIATVLFGSRTSVYRIVNAYQTHLLDACFEQPRPQASWLLPAVRRSVVALLAKVSSVYGWCRTRW